MDKRVRVTEDFASVNVEGEFIEQARRYTVDSLIGNSLRVLIANLARPAEKKLGIAGLGSSQMWTGEEESVMTRKEFAKMIGVRSSRLLERRVFVRIQERTFDITELVRQEGKKVYAPLLSREREIARLR